VEAERPKVSKILSTGSRYTGLWLLGSWLVLEEKDTNFIL